MDACDLRLFGRDQTQLSVRDPFRRVLASTPRALMSLNLIELDDLRDISARVALISGECEDAVRLPDISAVRRGQTNRIWHGSCAPGGFRASGTEVAQRWNAASTLVRTRRPSEPTPAMQRPCARTVGPAADRRWMTCRPTAGLAQPRHGSRSPPARGRGPRSPVERQRPARSPRRAAPQAGHRDTPAGATGTVSRLPARPRPSTDARAPLPPSKPPYQPSTTPPASRAAPQPAAHSTEL
jgi:hypothetical protein